MNVCCFNELSFGLLIKFSHYDQNEENKFGKQTKMRLIAFAVVVQVVIAFIHYDLFLLSQHTDRYID